MGTMQEIRKNSCMNGKILQDVRGKNIVASCRPCGLHDQMDRKAVVKRYGAAIPVMTLRRRIGLGCDLMNSDGSDRCQMTISIEVDPKEDRI
jgi:hypothetical protein